MVSWKLWGGCVLEEKDRERLYGQQVEQLYSLAPIGIIASLVNGTILTYIQWSVVSHNVLLAWLSALVLLNGLWSVLCYQFRNASRRPLDSYFWSRKFIGGTLASGVLWGQRVSCFFPKAQFCIRYFWPLCWAA